MLNKGRLRILHYQHRDFNITCIIAFDRHYKIEEVVEIILHERHLCILCWKRTIWKLENEKGNHDKLC